jgi:hypothetical protein
VVQLARRVLQGHLPLQSLSNWTLAIIAVTAFVLFMAVVFSLVSYLGWRELSRDDDEDEK